MSQENEAVGYKVWGIDNVVYGPVELPELVRWVQEGRVTADTWVFSEKDDAWAKAALVPELKMFFGSRAVPASPDSTRTTPAGPDTTVLAHQPRALRRVKILADLSNAQLARFVRYMSVERVREFTPIVRQGETGDAMYLVLEGELRVRMIIDGKETTLTTLGPGDFFGEIALFDHGPRSADVIANQESLLVKIGASAFARMVEEAPDLAAPFLYAVCKTLTARIRADNKRYRDSIYFARAAGKPPASPKATGTTRRPNIPGLKSGSSPA